MASSEGTGGGSDSALFSKLGGAFFGGPNSPQKVIANVRGLLANRLSGSISDTGNLEFMMRGAPQCGSIRGENVDEVVKCPFCFSSLSNKV